VTKHKKRSVHDRPWTAFVKLTMPPGSIYIGDRTPDQVWENSRYHVDVWFQGHDRDHAMGRFHHLAIRDHDQSARHDWRDLQRIKNELVGTPYFALEVYPAERALVDTCNQWHLYVFENWNPPFGFTDRMVGEGVSGAPNRPFEVKPADCLTRIEMQTIAAQFVQNRIV
jgi:hypothetical protein